MYEELSTILCDCENIVNSKLITTMFEDLELVPLTPGMFLRALQESGVQDLDQIDSTSLLKRYLYKLKLREDLRKDFPPNISYNKEVIQKGIKITTSLISET